MRYRSAGNVIVWHHTEEDRRAKETSWSGEETGRIRISHPSWGAFRLLTGDLSRVLGAVLVVPKLTEVTGSVGLQMEVDIT